MSNLTIQPKLYYCYRCIHEPMSLVDLIHHLCQAHSIPEHKSKLHDVEPYVKYIDDCDSSSTTSLECIICFKEFKQISYLRMHIEKKHYYCRMCIRLFQTQREFEEHEEEHNKDEILFLSCNICNIELSNHKDAIYHKKTRHPMERLHKFTLFPAKYTPNVFEKNTHYCPYCRFSCTVLRTVLHHIAYHKLQMCITCKEVVAVSENSLLLLGGECMKCKVNDSKLGFLEDVNKIMSVNSPKDSYALPCSYCNRKFTDVTALHIHLDVIHKYDCKFCIFSSTSQQALSLHGDAEHRSFFNCSCEKTYINYTEFCTHSVQEHSTMELSYALKHHSYLKQVPLQYDKIVNRLQCPYCKCSVIPTKYSNHLKLHNVMECVLCSKIKKYENRYSYNGKEFCLACKNMIVAKTRNKRLNTSHIVKPTLEVVKPKLQNRKILADPEEVNNSSDSDVSLIEETKVKPPSKKEMSVNKIVIDNETKTISGKKRKIGLVSEECTSSNSNNVARETKIKLLKKETNTDSKHLREDNTTHSVRTSDLRANSVKSPEVFKTKNITYVLNPEDIKIEEEPFMFLDADDSYSESKSQHLTQPQLEADSEDSYALDNTSVTDSNHHTVSTMLDSVGQDTLIIDKSSNTVWFMNKKIKSEPSN